MNVEKRNKNGQISRRFFPITPTHASRSYIPINVQVVQFETFHVCLVDTIFRRTFRRLQQVPRSSILLKSRNSMAKVSVSAAIITAGLIRGSSGIFILISFLLGNANAIETSRIYRLGLLSNSLVGVLRNLLLYFVKLIVWQMIQIPRFENLNLIL